MRQLQLFTTTELAGMRDRTAAHDYSPAGEGFRREHERRRAHGLERRHAERLRHATSPRRRPNPRQGISRPGSASASRQSRAAEVPDRSPPSRPPTVVKPSLAKQRRSTSPYSPNSARWTRRPTPAEPHRPTGAEPPRPAPAELPRPSARRAASPGAPEPRRPASAAAPKQNLPGTLDPVLQKTSCGPPKNTGPFPHDRIRTQFAHPGRVIAKCHPRCRYCERAPPYSQYVHHRRRRNGRRRAAFLGNASPRRTSARLPSGGRRGREAQNKRWRTRPRTRA